MSECKTVTLRTRPLKKGMLSFYLDYYPGYRDQETMKTIRHEGLNIYIYAPCRKKRRQSGAAASKPLSMNGMISLTSVSSNPIFWNITASSFPSMTRNGHLYVSTSTTSFMANVLSKRLISTFAINSVNTCLTQGS